MKHKCNISAVLLFLCVASTAHAVGREGGNGGDICEDRFKIVRDDIATWLNNGSAVGLSLPAGVTLDGYKAGMLDEISKAQIGCVDDEIQVDNAEKTCKNFVDSTGVPQIVCNTQRFMNTDQSDQYVLVHHEYAGLSGLELNNGSDSNYAVSNQISGYLEDEVLKKLAVKVPSAGLDDSAPAVALGIGTKFVIKKTIVIPAGTPFGDGFDFATPILIDGTLSYHEASIDYNFDTYCALIVKKVTESVRQIPAGSTLVVTKVVQDLVNNDQYYGPEFFVDDDILSEIDCSSGYYNHSPANPSIGTAKKMLGDYIELVQPPL
jgi:hypothetical protein